MNDRILEELDEFLNWAHEKSEKAVENSDCEHAAYQSGRRAAFHDVMEFLKTKRVQHEGHDHDPLIVAAKRLFRRGDEIGVNSYKRMSPLAMNIEVEALADQYFELQRQAMDEEAHAMAEFFAAVTGKCIACGEGTVAYPYPDELDDGKAACKSCSNCSMVYVIGPG